MKSDGRSVNCKMADTKSTVAVFSSHFDIVFA